MEVKFFDSKVDQFIKDLERPAYAKTIRILALLKKYGSELGMPHSKPLGEGLFELRMHGQQEVRIIYAWNQGDIVLLAGFVKKSDRIPAREMQSARVRFKALDES